MKYRLDISAQSTPGELSTFVSVSVTKLENTGDGLTTTTVFQERRELVWDIGQDVSVRLSALRGVTAFNAIAGLCDDI